MHIVAGVGNQRQALRVSRHIPGDPQFVLFEKKQVRIILFEEIGITDGAAPINCLEIETWGPEVTELAITGVVQK